MFEINKKSKIKTENVEGSTIYTIDNFYKNPTEIVKYFTSINAPLWKNEIKPSYNSLYFEDRRHSLQSDDIIKVYQYLNYVLGKKTFTEKKAILTNLCRFKKCEFNDYKNNYWFPHVDFDYNAIVYLNRWDFKCGTNLYEYLGPPIQDEYEGIEHYKPWKSKKKYRLIKSIKPRYNRMVLFDGKILHGMNICNDKYFSNNYRLNQVFFL